jgi:hypothetical protein
MSVSDYQMLSVIKTYIRNMRGKVDSADAEGRDPGASDDSPSPDEGMRKIVFDRIDEIVSEKIKKHET